MKHHLDCGFFFFNDTATTEIYTLSLHDALPICRIRSDTSSGPRMVIFSSTTVVRTTTARSHPTTLRLDRKSTRLNSSHANISYAVFCLKKKITTQPASSSPSVYTLLCYTPVHSQ